MKSIKILYIMWGLALAALVIITLNYRGEFTKFYGIAETGEIIVNSENAVEIKKIHVMPGQEVMKGDLLVELNNSDLIKKMNRISHELKELKARTVADDDALRCQIQELRAEKTSKISDLNYRIEQLQAKHANSENDTIKNGEDKLPNSVQMEIDSLEQARELAAKPILIRIDMLERKLNALDNPDDIQIERLESGLEMLLEDKGKLFIFSQVAGKISSVRCKEGEQILPFNTILTLHTKSPGFIKGFIHEKAHAMVSVGQKVKVVSLANRKHSVIGDVVGVGSRIVQYPNELRVMLGVPAYGREIHIKIPEDNSLMLGEKVLASVVGITEKQDTGRINDNFILKKKDENVKSSPFDNRYVSEIADIKVDKALKNIENIKASGVLYLKDLKKHLVVSDTTKNNKPVLFVMDESGNIEDEVRIRGLKKIDDMEAITEDDDGNIYIACSQSYDKDGKLTDKRKQLLRVKRDRFNLKLDRQVYLYDLLRNAANKYREVEWVKFITSEENNIRINIEGVFYQKGNLYLGFKSPLKDMKAVILRIIDIDKVFEENKLEENSVELWNEFALMDKASESSMGISDLYLHDNSVYILSYGKVETSGRKKDEGNLWVYDVERNRLSHIRHLGNLKPEGITHNPDKKEFVITFDQGRGRPSKIMKLKPFSL